MAFNPTFYAQARPDLKNNWEAANAPGADMNDPVVQYIKQFPSYEAYLQNDFDGNPNAEAQQASVSSAPTNAPTGAAQQIAQTQNTPIQTSPGGFTDLVNTNQPAALPQPKITVPAASAGVNTITNPDGSVTTTPAGNYAQNQTGAQAGNFSTTGNTQQTSGGLTINDLASLATSVNNQRQNTGGTSAGTQTTQGTQATQGTQMQSTGQSGVTATTGTTTAKPVDTLGFGELLKGQAGQVGANDAGRSAFLNDVMTTGGTQLGSQVDQAVRNAVSGPRLTGGGDSAQARAAGYAGAEIGRNNLDQRLAASNQLAGPTGLATLSTAANPYIGKQESTTGLQASTGGTTGVTSNTGLTSNAGTTNQTGMTTGFSDLMGTSTNTNQQAGKTATSGFQNTQDNTTGNAASTTGASAAGQIPQGQQVSTGGGGCIVCTVGIERGLWKNKRILRRVVRFKVQTAHARFRHAARGYFFLFTPFAKALLSSRWSWLAYFVMPVAKAIVYEELRVSERRLPFKFRPWFYHWTWHTVCDIVGRSVQKLPIPDYVTDPTLTEIGQRHNVFFKVGGTK